MVQLNYVKTDTNRQHLALSVSRLVSQSVGWSVGGSVCRSVRQCVHQTGEFFEDSQKL